MASRGTLGLCCVNITQLMTHINIQTLPFTLQLYCKLLGMLQRVTKSQKVHISIHGFPEWEWSWRNFLPSLNTKLIKRYVYYSLTANHLPYKYL